MKSDGPNRERTGVSRSSPKAASIAVIAADIDRASRVAAASR
jgi:hypothetical protein